MAEDGTRVSITHGALTGGLLAALSKVPAEHIARLRWMDFFDELSLTVSRRVAAKGYTSQRPALEGNPAQPVFGGTWKPFAPGFTVRQVGPVITVEGGTIHGLDVGAEIDIYPYDTTDFEAAAEPPARAVIDAAGLSTSTAKLVHASPASAPAPRMRARLVKPSPNAEPMRVRVRDVPPEVMDAAGLDKEAAGFVTLVAPGLPAHVEVRPFAGEIPAAAWGTESAGEIRRDRLYFQGARDGWALVRSDVSGVPGLLPDGFEATPDDILAYLPGAGSQIEVFSPVERHQSPASIGTGRTFPRSKAP